MDSWIIFWIHIIVLVSTGVGILGQTTGDVRLVDGSSSLEGRIDVYYDGSWGTICNQGWDNTDSSVVCRQLGFQVSLSSPSFGPGMSTQRIWLTNVQCEATDQRLDECITNDQWGQTSTCAHANDVGVRCSGLNVGIAPNFRGCYSFGDSPVLKRATTFPSNTIEDCIESCSLDSMFAGLHGITCTCDDQINPAAQPVDDIMCRMPCPGNLAQLCGDATVNMEFVSIYAVSVGDGYLSSPWFPGNYVLPRTDTSQPATLVSTTDVTASSGTLLLRVLAVDLASTDALAVEVGGMTTSITAPGDIMLTGLPATAAATLTVTLMRAATSAGASGFLIDVSPSTATTAMPPSPPSTPINPGTNQPDTASSPPPGTPLAPATPGVVTSIPTEEATSTQDSPAPVTQGPVVTVQPVVTTAPSMPTTCDHPVVERGNITGVDQSPYQIRQRVVLDCNDGLTPADDTFLVCQSDGTWTPSPVCTSVSSGIPVWQIIVIAVVIALVVVIMAIIFLICLVAFGKKKERPRRDDEVRAITHMATPGDNEYTGRPPLIPINEASASGLVRQGTNMSTASTIPDPPPPPHIRSNDAVQQTEPILPPPPSQPAPDPPSPTETYPPVDYPGHAGGPNRDSVISNGTAHSNGHVNHLGNEERQAVDELINAVRDYDDSPGVMHGSMYGSVPPRHLRSGSTLSVISNPGRVTDGRTSPRYSGNLRSVQFDKHNYRP